MAALKSGGGVFVRQSVKKEVAAKYKLAQSLKTRRTQIATGKKGKHRGSVVRKGKRLNIRALMVQRELALRESGRGFLGYTSRFTRFGRIAESKHLEHFSRYKRLLTKAGLSISQDKQTLAFNFQPKPSEGLSTSAAQSAISEAIREVESDINVYLQRKELERLERSIAQNVRRAA
jgi:hypothetical protein